MTKIKNLFAALAFTLISTAAFSNDAPTKALQELRMEIAEQLGKIDVQNLDENELSLNVTFLVNNDNEIIILTTNDKEYDGTIKALLNYRKVETDGVKKNTVIAVPIKLKKY